MAFPLFPPAFYTPSVWFFQPFLEGQFSPFFWQPFLIETCLRRFFVGDFRDIAVMIKPAKTAEPVQISCPSRRAWAAGYIRDRWPTAGFNISPTPVNFTGKLEVFSKAVDNGHNTYTTRIGFGIILYRHMGMDFLAAWKKPCQFKSMHHGESCGSEDPFQKAFGLLFLNLAHAFVVANRTHDDTSGKLLWGGIEDISWRVTFRAFGFGNLGTHVHIPHKMLLCQFRYVRGSLSMSSSVCRKWMQ